VQLVVLGGSGSAAVAATLATAWDVTVISDRPAHVGALAAVVDRVVPVTTEPNRTTVVTPDGQLDADEWVAQGRPGRLLAVRIAGRPAVNDEATSALAAAGATVIGPDDPDLVIDPILKVLGQGGIALARPVIAIGHGHHRFENFADHHVEVTPATAAGLITAVNELLQGREVHHHG
jgi:hypothetical protein